MFSSPAFTRNGWTVLLPQDYVAYNRGDMFTPARQRVASMVPIVAGALATPSATAGTHVHSVPVVYVMPNAHVRPQIGWAITPQAVVN